MKRKLPTPTHPGSRFSHRPTKAEKLNCWRNWHIGVAPFHAAAFACAAPGKPAETETWNTARDHLRDVRGWLANTERDAGQLAAAPHVGRAEALMLAQKIACDMDEVRRQLELAERCAALTAAAVDALRVVQ